MPGKPTIAMKARRKRSAVSVFRVEPAQPYGWMVYLHGFPKTPLFVDRALALMYAREWAKTNVPSVIQVAGSGRQLERKETYGDTKLARFRAVVGRRVRKTG
jgi:hypothetical protein